MTALEQNLESLKKDPVVKASKIKLTKADKDLLDKEIAEYKNCAEIEFSELSFCSKLRQT